ncbi:DUF2939 domain-containing protein [Methylobacterium dankookense]|uniref:DUF2939 domain-containing protein n=1 Tax=Methylobacterium dankookense TaxID=560405 RepID=A0A564FXE9_9HYPH|nr:DUF2939 domain-containing protein [Methylobacterium dankookense]GJD59181.1 hypothetical protein IFDJLNFL_5108 [Methylobacterium dankookense]VUF12446.1 hypothetical protein MTDSW087_02138 [Methylobacterium dankookense]
MRWLAVPLAIAFGWLLFTLSPLWALYDLARAVRARDVAYVERHVNFRTLRLSLVRQTSAAVKAAADSNPGLEPRERQQLSDAAVGLALALAETMVTPETVIDLLDDGWPQRLDLPRPETQPAAGLNLDRIGKLVPYYLTSEMRGFRTVVVPVPPEAPRALQTRIRMRLRGWSWRLIDIEVNEALRQRMAAGLAKTIAKAQQGPGRN